MNRVDDYLNVLTGLGGSRDKSTSTTFARGCDLTHVELDDLYEHDAISARIVDRVVDDATRGEFSLTGTDESYDWASMKSELDDHDVVSELGDGWRWARLYGGAVVVMDVDDGLPMEQPLDLSRATRLRSLQVVESPYVQPTQHNRGLGARAWRRPLRYQVSAGSRVRQVHHTRLIRFDGVRVSSRRLLERGGWGPSVLDRPWSAMRRLGSVEGYAETILHELSVMTLKLEGFENKMAQGQKGQSEVKQVFEMMRYAIDNLHILVMDQKDEYGETARSVTGIDLLLKHFVDALVRNTDMPRTILLGEQPGGLNATAEAETRGWYDHVASAQKNVLSPALNRVLTILFALRKQRGGQVPSEWTIEYEPLWQPSEKEQAETELVWAQADALRMADSVVSPDEVRARLLKRGHVETTDGRPMLREPELGT